MIKLADINSALSAYSPSSDRELIQKAYNFVQVQHKGQTRSSGEPYVNHVTEVALLSTKLRLDSFSITAALLHDVVEDTDVTLEDISKNFGTTVAELVGGVTKLSKISFSSRAELQAENFRKMLLAMSQDIRVLLIKLCDRTHNMRTLEFLSESRQVRIASETLEIYAPLSHRLGIHWMKSELEDLSFRYLKPKIYQNIKKSVAEKKKERELYIENTVSILTRELSQNKLKGDVKGRSKNFYSIYRKMEAQGLTFEEIYDLIAFRIIVDSLIDCYHVLGVLHAAWKPIPGRFKDYIAMPKANRYQSLHTTLIGPEGIRMEVQIRTTQMHDVAEGGVAAHWVYKESGKENPVVAKGAQATTQSEDLSETKQFAWVKELLESDSLHSDPIDFISAVKEDLSPQEVYAFTPRGDLFALQEGSTPIDFAYYVHSEIGDHCSSAKINGQQVSLDYKIQNGDTVEITTSRNQHPSKDWLKFVASSKAKQRVRAWLKNQEATRSVDVGKELISKDLRKLKVSLTKLIRNGKLLEVSKKLGYNDTDSLFSELGYGKLRSDFVIEKLFPEKHNVEEVLSQEETALQKIFHKAAKAFRESASIKVNGLDDVVFRFAKCCEPLPGDMILGFVTRGRGVTVHRRDCGQTMSFDSRRLVPVSWDESVKSYRRIRLKVKSTDKVGLLGAMSLSISSAGANIVSVHAEATLDGKALNIFEVNVENSSQLDRIKRNLENLEGVLAVNKEKGKRVKESNKEQAKEKE